MDNVPNTMWGLIIIKKLYLLITLLILLVGCGGADEDVNNSDQEVTGDEEDAQDETMTLSDEEMDLMIIDDESLQITLKRIVHERNGITDRVSLEVEVENKENKTLEFYLKNFKIDGKDINSTHAWISDVEIKPNETIRTTINGYEDEELTIVEHVAGTLIVNDYENNRIEIGFSEYINE